MKFSSKLLLFVLLCSLATSGHAVENQPNSAPQKPPSALSTTAEAPATLDELLTFTPPAGWVMADPKALPPTVKVMVVGKARSILPPSINLATEPYNGTLKEFLRKIKKMNEENGCPWKDLGTIRTQAGPASLSQADFPTKWGDMRMMHVILIRNGSVFILSASSLKAEFPLFYKDFFTSLRSLRIVRGSEEINQKNGEEKAGPKEPFLQKIGDHLTSVASTETHVII